MVIAFYNATAMSVPFAKTIWRIGMGWGVLWLGLGVMASFAIGANDMIFSLMVFALVFVLPVTAVVVARRSPIFSGLALLVAFAVVAVGTFAQGGSADLLAMLRHLYLWFHLLFGTAFVVLHKPIQQAFPIPAKSEGV